MIYIYSLFICLLSSLLLSYVMLVIDRKSFKESITGSSVCNYCNHQLTIIDIIPIFSYLILLGKCRFCNKAIPIKYFIVETVFGVLISSSYLLYGFSINFLVIVLASLILFIESLIDIESNIVSDRIWIIGFIILLIIRAIYFEYVDYLLSSIIMFSFLYILAVITEKIFKKETLGGGDIKLYLFIGMVLDLRLALLSLFLASVFGLIYAMIKKSKSDTYLPLVPFISLGVFVSYFWGNDLINWYLSLLGI